MKITTTIALIGLAATASVHAQNATIYGIVDTGIESISNTAAGGRLIRMPSATGIFPSRVGFRGKEDLGDGLAAIYTLEMGFAPDTGAAGQGGRLFGRQSYVGLSSNWGTVTLGRQYSMLFYSILDAAILGTSTIGVAVLDPYIPNARMDNTIAYLGKFDGLTLGATYSLGRDTVNAGPSIVGANCAGESGSDSQACRALSAMVKYDTPTWGTALAYDKLRGRTLSSSTDAVYGGLNSSSMTDSRLTANGYVKLAGVKVAGGLIRRNNDGSASKPKSDLLFFGASYPINTAWTVEGVFAQLRYKNIDNADSRMFSTRVLYKLSNRTTLYALLGTMRNQSLANVSISAGAPGSNPALGGSQTGSMLGISHTF